MNALTSPPRADVAVIGVGALAEAIVRGLCADETAAPHIVLSPRGRERTARLVRDLPTVRVATDNQAAVDAADTVLVCVRPPDAPEALSALSFAPAHRVVSVMAAVSLGELRGLVAPAEQVWRALPGPAVSRRQGVTPVFPAGGSAEAIFARLGTVLAVPEEAHLDAASVAAATVAAHLRYVGTAVAWLADEGVGHAVATRYLAGLYGEVGAELRGVDDVAAEAASHATPGGLNERFAQALDDAGYYRRVRDELDALRDSTFP